MNRALHSTANLQTKTLEAPQNKKTPFRCCIIIFWFIETFSFFEYAIIHENSFFEEL